jgi:hypothetical protein
MDSGLSEGKITINDDGIKLRENEREDNHVEL